MDLTNISRFMFGTVDGLIQFANENGLSPDWCLGYRDCLFTVAGAFLTILIVKLAESIRLLFVLFIERRKNTSNNEGSKIPVCED